jgi:hypothetical protein
LRYKAVTAPNVSLWERPHLNGSEHTSHGVTMDEAIRNHIHTKYVLMLDSDVITERHGFIEGMLEQFKQNDKLYGTGSLMLVTKKNYACGYPENEADTLRYAHPSCSIIDRDKYLEIAHSTKTILPGSGQEVENVFCDHGSPCVYSMMGAETLGYAVEYFPVDKYTSHLSGASWTNPRTIWNHDHGVFIRPFITFITQRGQALPVIDEADTDYDIVPTGLVQKKHVVIHGQLPTEFSNAIYAIRNNVTGEYVCDISKTGLGLNSVGFEHPEKFSSKIISEVKLAAIKFKAPDEINVDGFRFFKRNYWQKNICFK